MRIIFDENVPWPLRQFLPDHDITSVQREGFGGMENGELLNLLDGNFDVFVLCDKNLRYQQNLSERAIAIVELPTNRWPFLMNLQAEIVRAVASSFSGSYLTVEEPAKGEQDVDPNA
jgi:hypothetical protein